MNTPDLGPVSASRIPSDATVLIVSGDASTRRTLREIVVASGLRAVELESAAKYLDYPTLGPAACVILDVVLPDIDGLELQESTSYESAPVVFVARQASVKCSVRAIKAGACDFLTLPCCPEILIQAVRAAIRSDLRTRADREKFAALRARLAQLTRREREVFSLVASGLPNKLMAQHMRISMVTVQIHRGRVMEKMGARSLAELIRIADVLRIPLTSDSRFQTHSLRWSWAVIENPAGLQLDQEMVADVLRCADSQAPAFIAAAPARPSRTRPVLRH